MEDLDLLPQKHEVNKCTYVDPVGNIWLFLHFRGIHCLWFIFSLFCTHLLAVSATAVKNVADIFRAFENIPVILNTLKDSEESKDCLHFIRSLRPRMCWCVLFFFFFCY